MRDSRTRITNLQHKKGHASFSAALAKAMCLATLQELLLSSPIGISRELNHINFYYQSLVNLQAFQIG